MRGWTVALPLIAVGVALSGDAAARGVVAAAADTTETAHRTEKTTNVEGHRFSRHAHRAVAHHAKLAARTPDVDEKAPPATAPHRLAPPPPVHQGEPDLQPHTVSTVRIAPPAAPPEAPEAAPVAETAPDTNAARDLNAALTNLLAAAAALDDTAPGGESEDAPGPSTAIELLAVFGICASVAAGCLGLVALNARRRDSLVLAPPRRIPARPLPVRDDRLTQRVAQQRLFPHQFGAAIRS